MPELIGLFLLSALFCVTAYTSNKSLLVRCSCQPLICNRA
ncbi:hypothetical protein L579_4452 [Pantoea sp. AS-PWVM4]|nr:hypothetical protein L579_4452 [Pantoea sp. AS-PWVM4]